jgi:hypothetical protein
VWRPAGHSLARVLALVLIAPVLGGVTDGFDPGRPFEAGRHRGVDLAAAPGTPVRAACDGPVVFAGRIAGTGIVTLRCGPWRVTHMPLGTIHARGPVARGTVIGTVAASPDHAGLHLGVRREGTRFGYVDPLRFLGRRPRPLGPAPPPRSVRPPPRFVRPPPAAAARRVRPHRSPHTAAPRQSSPLAPWPAWAGLALVLAGAGLRVRARWRTYSNPVVTAAER